jgi:hypothetical protein
MLRGIQLDFYNKKSGQNISMSNIRGMLIHAEYQLREMSEGKQKEDSVSSEIISAITSTAVRKAYIFRYIESNLSTYE